VSFVGVEKVYTVADGRAQSREVKIGERRGEEQSITGGIKEGEQVIVSGIGKVQPGTAVRMKAQ
jgi:membrane fusion protein (multidrug efflux system)